MSDEFIVRHCSPTLAGIKTGSLFTYEYMSKDELNHGIRRLNRKLVGKGLRVIPLRVGDKRALIYVFRPSMLEADISKRSSTFILRKCGYETRTADSCVMQLISRLRQQEEFPHEIGLFLGYPPEDVIGFIENKGKYCKCVGTWKVYGDEAKARETFRRFRRCTDHYIQRIASGNTIEQLTVVVN